MLYMVQDFTDLEKKSIKYWHRIGNYVLTTFSNMLTNINLTDMEVGFVFKTAVLKEINLKENRFGFEPEITAKISKKLNIFEIGISYFGEIMTMVRRNMERWCCCDLVYYLLQYYR